VATQLCGCCLDAMDVVMRLLGPIFICLAIGLIGFSAYTTFTVILPNLADTSSSPTVLILGFLQACFLVVNLFYNYAMSICTSPGNPPELLSQEAKELEELLVESNTPPKQCHKCNRLKPPRSHHCSVCKRCVTKMDHHCPWINNCVGWGNYRYFCLFMLYLALSCLFVVIAGANLFLQSFLGMRRYVLSHGNNGSRLRLTLADVQCVSLSWMLSACIMLALLGLGGFHAWLVASNQTTIEFHTNMGQKESAKRKGTHWRNPYDLGACKNFEQVFGPNRFLRFIWMMPYVARRPAGDGMSFPRISDMET